MDGVERFAIDFNKRYVPYPKQSLYHSSLKPYRFLGGAAGPGKTACGIVDQMMRCNRFGAESGPHVHTLMLRRTTPKLEATLITRFRELIPRELYSRFKQSPGQYEVIWKNGSSTRFGSMQYDENAWDYQGQWLDIFYDELCEFTFNQWNATGAWNRCPVSKFATKGGAGNPIGIGAPWVRRVFVDKTPCEEMDDDQRKLYDSRDYDYFPCTYLDNPKFANDPTFHKNLMAYPAPIRDALMNGSWDVVGGYFEGAFDQAENVCGELEAVPKPWHRRWISGDWGFTHFSAIYWHFMDDYGVLRTYKEVLVQKHDPDMLAEMIVKESLDEQGKMPRYEAFPFSHDAFASNNTRTFGADANSIAGHMGRILTDAGLPSPFRTGGPGTKLSREQHMYNALRRKIPCGANSEGLPRFRKNWVISETCTKLIECLGTAPRDEKKPEEIATFLGDDPLQGAGYGVYHIFGDPRDKPLSVVKQELWQEQPERSVHSKVMQQMAYGAAHSKKLGRSKWAR
jgi:hypothetical protein